ncbi:MAG: DegT/DnrJ/EryC1/StrS family aminotransferase [Chloroflexi bacterium]|nr:DegT/DnrJ/EryC1/StrS family aminotransferase [Chloroflexota bacterium]
MRKLAINGGEPVRAPRNPWPTWPVCTERAVELVTEVVRSGVWSYDGPKEWEFARQFADFSGLRYALTVANGTVAIQLALEALGIGAYDEVIVPGLTWQATAAACLEVNAVPVLVDIDPETYCLDVAAAEAAITSRTRAIIVVHLYGAMADMDAVIRLARSNNLSLIEDCAHQHGSQWRGQGVGGLGDVGAFSLQQSKVLTSGEGGINTTNDWDLFQKLYSLRNCGRPFQDGAPTLQSGNYRATEMQAALLLAQMEQMADWVAVREQNARRVDACLESIMGLRPMLRHEGVTRQSYYCYSFRYDEALWGGVPVAKFREAFAAETGLAVGSTYEPLNNCSLYKPHTKPRYRISEAHWAAIDPGGYRLPAAAHAYAKEGVVIWQPFLLAGQKDIDDIVNALQKISQNRDELPSA